MGNAHTRLSFFFVTRLTYVIHCLAIQVLPMYPCLDKGDTIAFRNAATKYMENIRTTALRSNTRGSSPPPPPKKASGTSKTTSKPPIPARDGKGPLASSSTASTFGWWWKEILPRASVLQDCSGDRFERLLLALSVHALFTLSSQIDGSSKHEELADTSLASLHVRPFLVYNIYFCDSMCSDLPSPTIKDLHESFTASSYSGKGKPTPIRHNEPTLPTTSSASCESNF